MCRNFESASVANYNILLRIRFDRLFSLILFNPRDHV